MDEETPTLPESPELPDLPAEIERVRQRLPALPFIVRMVLLVAGWVFLLIGIAGLVLPGIQGCLTIVFAAAVLSLASEMVYRVLKRLLQRWPKSWDRVERLRGWMHGKLYRAARPIERFERWCRQKFSRQPKD